MRRTVIVISLCFLLGVITTVVVAWSCVVWDRGDTPSFDLRRQVSEFEVNGWHGEIYTWTGLTSVRAIGDENRPMGTSDSAAPPSWVNLDDPPDELSDLYARAAGWPWRCLHYVRERRGLGFIRDWDYDEHGVIVGANPLADLSENWAEVNRLPIAPLWAGMLGDVVVFAAGWFVTAMSGWPRRWQRARWRRKRNLCQHCKYDQRSSLQPQRCPECGRPPQGHRPLFGAPSIIALAMACVFSGGALTVFGMVFVATKPYSVIHYAAYHGDTSTVEAELARGVDIESIISIGGSVFTEYEVSPLLAAVGGDRIDTIQFLIGSGADVNTSLSGVGTPLFWAMIHEDLTAAQLLLDSGADVNAMSSSGFTALVEAAGKDRISALEFLVDHGFDMTRAATSLWVAVQRGHRDFVERMLELGAPVTYDAIAKAVRSGDLGFFELMLKHGGDPLARSSDGNTTLLSPAKSEGDGLEICRLLLEAGVDVNAAGFYGYTALMSAVDDVELVRFLLENGADVAAVNYRGETAAIQAEKGGNVEAHRLLLERAAELDDPSDP